MPTCPYCGTRDKCPARDSCGPCDQPIKTPPILSSKPPVRRDTSRWPRRERIAITRISHRHHPEGRLETFVVWRSTIKARATPFAGRTTY